MESDPTLINYKEQVHVGQNLLANQVRPKFSFMDMLMNDNYSDYENYDLINDLPAKNFEEQSAMGESSIAHPVVPAFTPQEETCSMFQNSLEQHHGVDGQIAAGFGEDVSKKRIWLTAEEIQEQTKDAAAQVANKRFRQTLSISDPVGRELYRTPAMAAPAQHIQFSNCSTPANVGNHEVAPAFFQKEKHKASKFNASLLRIGSWEIKPIYEGDLIGKCYYGRKKLMWEITENGYERKIEFSWSTISCMEVFPNQENPTRFTIWLKEPPAFYKQVIGSKKVHTIWTKSEDFTDGQASNCRMHYLEFPDEEFGKSYINLLRSDSRLMALSKVSSPTVPRPPLPATIREAPRQSTHCRPHSFQSYSSSLLSLSTQALPLHYLFMNNLLSRKVADEGSPILVVGNPSTYHASGVTNNGAPAYPILARPWMGYPTMPFGSVEVNYNDQHYGNVKL